MKFSDVLRGTRATRDVVLPIWGQDVPLAVRPLNGLETSMVLERGRAFAVAKGVSDPKDGDRLYDLGLMAHTLAIACVDREGTEKPFFDGGVEQILEALDADRIVLLYEAQQALQDECAGRITKLDPATYMAKVVEVAEAKENEDPLADLRPSMRRAWERTTAAQLWSLLRSRSASTSSSDAAAPSSSNAPS
jgi:hypothetical protein